MKTLSLSVLGTRYDVRLEDGFADFIFQEFQEVGLDTTLDNKPEKLLQAYLRLAKQQYIHDDEIEKFIKQFDIS